VHYNNDLFQYAYKKKNKKTKKSTWRFRIDRFSKRVIFVVVNVDALYGWSDNFFPHYVSRHSSTQINNKIENDRYEYPYQMSQRTG